MSQRLVVIGGGGFGREVLELIDDMNLAGGSPTLEVVGVLDDGSPDNDLLARLGTRHLGGTETLRDLDADVAPGTTVLGVPARPKEQ